VSAPRHRFLSALATVLTSLPPPCAPIAGCLTSLRFLCRSLPAAPTPPSTFLIAAPLLEAGEPCSDGSRADHHGDATLDLPPLDTGAAQPGPLLAALPRRRSCTRATYGRARAVGCKVVGRDLAAHAGRCRRSCRPRGTAPLGHGQGIDPLALFRHFFSIFRIYSNPCKFKNLCRIRLNSENYETNFVG
jgi:hypothetical protein